MSNRQTGPRTVRSSHFDLAAVAILGVWTVGTGLGLGPGGAVRAVLGFLAVLLAPGYALVSALFPRRRGAPGLFPEIGRGGGSDTVPGDGAGDSPETGAVTVVERLVLAVGLSVCLVPLIGLGVHFGPVEIRSETFLGAVGTATVTLAAVAAVRRFLVPPDVRFTPRYAGVASDAWGHLERDGSGSVPTLLLVVGLVVAVGGIGVAVVDTESGERFTEFSLTTQDPETGESVAGGYPEEIAYGETGAVQVGIANEEGETMQYTVAVYLQSFDGSGAVGETHRLDTFAVTVEHGESVELDHEISPEMAGEDLKVSYHLYVGTPRVHGEPRPEESYRTVHFWIDVPEPGSADG